MSNGVKIHKLCIDSINFSVPYGCLKIIRAPIPYKILLYKSTHNSCMKNDTFFNNIKWFAFAMGELLL